MFPIIATLRDLREFLAAKKRKREPIRWIAKPVGCATYKPSDALSFLRFRESLRGAGDFGRASERVDALEHALRARHSVGLPLPRNVMQNEDRSLTFFWEGVMVRCFQDGFVSLIGGTAGVKAKKITTELLDLLAFQVRIQSA